MPAGQARISFVGSLGGDPEVREVGNSTVANFNVAVTERKKDGDQWVDAGTTWYRCSAWREIGSNAAASLHKGDRVMIEGTIGERKYTDKEGTEKSSWEVTVEELGASLRFATVELTRSGGSTGRQPARGQQGRTQPVQQQRREPQVAQAWAGGYDDNTPF